MIVKFFDYEVLLCIERLLCPSVTHIDLGATFPGANMVQGKNTVRVFTTRTFYTSERKYAYKMYDIFTSRNVKKNLLISTLTSDQDQNVRPNSVDSQICRTFVGHLSDILGEICRT